MKLRPVPTAICLILFVSIAFSAVIMDGTLSATPGASKITLRWVSSDESGVTAYAIARAAGYSGTEFMALETIPARGSGSSYEYVDNTVFKTNDSFYRYRLTPIDRDGRAVGDQYYTNSTLPKVSGVRRTWGSIKAMFR